MKEEIKIKFQGKELKIEKHFAKEFFCPFCRKELFCLFDAENRILSFAIDPILFCKSCETFWYNEVAYFSLKKIYDLKEWGIEIEKVDLKRKQKQEM
jgi:transcription elongation factor Elf1